MKVKVESEKVGLKLNIQKTKIMASGPITSWEIWTIVRQAPLSMRFPRPEYWSELPFPLPGDLPNLGIEPVSPTSPALAGGFFTTSATWEAPKPVGWTDLQPSVQTDSSSPDSFIHWEYSEQSLEKQETGKYLSAYNVPGTVQKLLFFFFFISGHCPL